MITGRYGSASSYGRYGHTMGLPAPSSGFGTLSLVPWTNMPAAATEAISPAAQGANFRWGLDFRDEDFGWQRVACGNPGGAANAEAQVRYSINNGASFSLFPNSFLAMDLNTDNSENYLIPDEAKIATLWLMMLGRNGNGAIDPFLNGLTLGLTNAARAGSWSIPWQGSRNPHWFSSASKKREYFRGFAVTSVSGTWTNMPLALTVMPNPPAALNPFTIDNIAQWHSGYLRQMINVQTIGAAAAVLQLQYSINGGANFQFIDSETTNTGAPIGIAVLGLRISPFVKIDKALLRSNQANVQIRIMGQGGNGAADPIFRNYGFETVQYDPSLY